MPRVLATHRFAIDFDVKVDYICNLRSLLGLGNHRKGTEAEQKAAQIAHLQIEQCKQLTAIAAV